VQRSIGCENCLDPSPVSPFSQVRLHCSPLGRDGGWVSRLGLLLLVASIGAAITVNELVGKPVPFLRWSFLTMMLRGRHLLREWQVGDGRETALEKYVVASTRPGDVDDFVGTLGDGGESIRSLRREYSFTPGSLDLVFLERTPTCPTSN
jgi:hypothetical protein